EALKHPSVEQVTMVEIDGDVIKVAKEHFRAVHNGAFDNPKLRVIVDDGVKFWRETQEKFDLIALDLNDPMGPAEALYSTEFFQQLRAALAPGGALTLHIGSSEGGAGHGAHPPPRLCRVLPAAARGAGARRSTPAAHRLAGGAAGARGPARPAPERGVPHRAAVHHVHPALRLPVGEGRARRPAPSR